MTHRAIVLGSGVAGLLAARVASDHFDEVVVIDRDVLEDVDAPRAGVPQGRHTHVLLHGGAVALNRYFPGFCDELVRNGAVRGDAGADTLTAWNGVFRPRIQLGLALHLCTRPLLENRLRRRVRALPGLTFLARTEALGFVRTGGRLSGVRLRALEGGAETELAGDLIIDASGRASKTPQWLVELGLPAVDDTVVEPHLGYASRMYRAAPNAPFKLLALFNLAPTTRGGSIIEVEGQRWSAVLAGCGGDYPPTDERDYLEYARSLAHPVLYECLRHAEPLTPVLGWRRTENRLRHFHAMPRPAEGLVVLGDALCALNPFYGQGMTMASMHADALAGALRSTPRARVGSASFVRTLQRQLRRVSDVAWAPSVGLDMHYPTTDGPRLSLLQRAQRALGDRALAATATNTNVGRAFFPLLHLTGSPLALLSPRALWGTLRGPQQGELLRDPPPPLLGHRGELAATGEPAGAAQA